MEDVLYLAGIGFIVGIVSIDKFCEVYGYKNAVSFVKTALPFTGIISAVAAIWMVAS